MLQKPSTTISKRSRKTADLIDFCEPNRKENQITGSSLGKYVSSAKQVLLFRFWKRRNHITSGFTRGRPQTLCLLQRLGKMRFFCEAEPTLLLLFWKRRKP
jgi:hypothetical protein